jgi:dTDP-4-amino-4,6-dideoxygalactose transaminase
MDEITAICQKHNAVLIEDAAEALSAKYNGQECGTFGKYNAISFNGNKIITTSGGGMLITNDKTARDKAFYWATQSREPLPWYEHKEIGYNYRMSNVVAGIGRGQLLHLEEHRKLKTEIFDRYQKGFENSPLSMNPYLENTVPNFWLSCILLDKSVKTSIHTILEKLNEHNIETRPLWKPMHMQPVFMDNDFITAGETAVDEDLFSRGLCLPSDIKMTEAEQQKVIDLIKSLI